MSEQMNELLLTAAQVAQTLGVSKRQVFRLNSSAKIPAPIKIAGATRWRAQEIAAWIRAAAPDRKTWISIKEPRR